jgi:radical SAM-linked protein
VPTAPDPTTAPPARGSPPGPADKVRIRFRKDGALRLLSHHDLLRTFERMLRRAELPFRRTRGFNPRPRLVFALSLPLGVVGRDEVVELELDEVLPPEEIHERLSRQSPAGLAILGVRRIDPRAGVHVRGLSYGLAVPADRLPDLRRRVAEVLAAPHCWVERTRPPQRRIDLRPLIRDARLAKSGGGAFLEIDLSLTAAGTARPEELLTLLGLRDLLDSGAVLERTRLELEEDARAGTEPGPSTGRIHDASTPNRPKDEG